jgi:hypothetical protein
MGTTADPRCPECGEPIGQTATYCMHCSADLTAERAVADVDDDGGWDRTTGTAPAEGPSGTAAAADTLLDPDGAVDDTLTVVVGIVGGLLVGVVGTIVLLTVTGSGWSLALGVAAWLGATAYLVRRRTVQEAVAKGAYSLAAVLLSVPVIALSPFVDVDGGLAGRGGLFVVLLVFAVVPAGVAAVVGWVASRFVPESAGTDG